MYNVRGPRSPGLENRLFHHSACALLPINPLRTCLLTCELRVIGAAGADTCATARSSGRPSAAAGRRSPSSGESAAQGVLGRGVWETVPKEPKELLSPCNSHQLIGERISGYRPKNVHKKYEILRPVSFRLTAVNPVVGGPDLLGCCSDAQLRPRRCSEWTGARGSGAD